MPSKSRNKEPTKANGYTRGRPDGVEYSELDKVIERAIEGLPMELRLYPDVYSWIISAEVIKFLGKNYTYTQKNEGEVY